MSSSIKFDLDITNPPDAIMANAMKGIKGAMTRSTLLGAEIVAGEIRRSIRDRLRQHTGKLGRSFRATLRQPKSKGEVRAGAYSDLVYARIQDEGGTVTPKSARALTVPLTSKAKSASRAGRGAREFKGVLELVWPKGKSTGWLVERKRRKSILHYLLTRSVRVPGVKYRDAAVKAASPQVQKVIGAEISKSIDEAEE